MDTKYQEQFFRHFMSKFARDINFIGEDALYKIFWSFVRTNRVNIEENGFDWLVLKSALQKRIGEFSASTISKLLVLTSID